jgi:hypothetical protein
MRAEVVDILLLRINPLANVSRVRQGDAEPDNPHGQLRLCANVVHARNNDLVDVSQVAAQQVKLIGDEKIDGQDIFASLPLSGQHIPLRRCCKDQVSFFQ